MFSNLYISIHTGSTDEKVQQHKSNQPVPSFSHMPYLDSTPVLWIEPFKEPDAAAGEIVNPPLIYLLLYQSEPWWNDDYSLEDSSSHI